MLMRRSLIPSRYNIVPSKSVRGETLGGEREGGKNDIFVHRAYPYARPLRVRPVVYHGILVI